MHTIKLNVSDNVYDKLIRLLEKFDKSELEVIQDDNYVQNKQYLDSELKMVKEGNAKYISITDLDKSIEKTIKKHEN